MQAEILSQCPLFAGLTHAERDLALAYWEACPSFYSKGATLHPLGEPLPFFGLVISGQIQVHMEDADGAPLLMATVGPGGTFGESLHFLHQPAPVFIIAVSDTRILQLHCHRLQALFPPPSPLELQFSRRFMQMLSMRTLEMNNRIQVLSKLTIREKLNTLFAAYCHSAGSRTFSLPFDRESMAAYLGVNRSALSRELSRMQKDGILTYQKNNITLL